MGHDMGWWKAYKQRISKLGHRTYSDPRREIATRELIRQTAVSLPFQLSFWGVHMKSILAIAICVLFAIGNANATPEQSYEGGKAAADNNFGTKHDVDDRGFSERAADAARDAGRESAGGSPPDHGKEGGGKESNEGDKSSDSD